MFGFAFNGEFETFCKGLLTKFAVFAFMLSRINSRGIIPFLGYAAMLPFLLSVGPNERLLVMLTEFFVLFSHPILLFFAFPVSFAKQQGKPVGFSDYLKPCFAFFIVAVMAGASGFALVDSLLPFFYFLFSSALKLAGSFGQKDPAAFLPLWVFRSVVLILTAFITPLWGILYFSIMAFVSLVPEKTFAAFFKLGPPQKRRVTEETKTVDELIAEGLKKKE